MEIKQRARAVIKKLSPVWVFLKASVTEWSEDKALRHAAALAYYSVFSLAPLLVIAISVAGFVFSEQAVRGEIVEQLEDFVGPDAAVFVENMIRRAGEVEAGWVATLLSVGVIVFGALIIFSAVQDVLNLIWGVKPKPEAGLKYTIGQRLLAFLMILLFGLAVLGALLTSAAVRIAEAFWDQWFNGELGALWYYVDQGVWLLFFTAMFGVIYKLLPDVKMAWRDVWIGAFMTSLLFGVGLFAISTYVAYSSVGSVFGAAGTLAVLLVWVYYSWVIVLMGAEMTQVWARRFGHGIEPGDNAVFRSGVRGTVSDDSGPGGDSDSDDGQLQLFGDAGYQCDRP